jgi:hypothetical protein
MRRPAPSHVDISPALKRLSHPIPATYQTAALTRGQIIQSAVEVKPRTVAHRIYPALSKKTETQGAMSPLGGGWKWPGDR